MRKLILILLLNLTILFACLGEARAATTPMPAMQWMKMLGLGTARAVQPTSDGGYVLTGWTQGQPGAGSDIFLIKTDGQGNKYWKSILHGNGFSCAYGVGLTHDGGIIVVGDTKSKTADDHDVLVVKVDAQGQVIWERNFGGPCCDYGAAVIPTSDGGCLVAGGTESYGAGLYDIYLLKLNDQGQQIWAKTYGGRGSDCGYALLPAKGGYVIAGNTDSTDFGKTNVYLLKTDVRGNLLWEQKYGGSCNSYGWSLQQRADGGYTIAGETEVVGMNGGGLKAYLIQTDALGNKIRDRIYGDQSYSTAYAVAPSGKGASLLVGKQEAIRGSHILYLLRTDHKGQIMDGRTLSDLGDSCAYAVQPTRDGAYIIAGEQGSAAQGNQQILLIKLAPAHFAIWKTLLIGLSVLVILLLLFVYGQKRYYHLKTARGDDAQGPEI